MIEKEKLRNILYNSGAVAVGFSRAHDVPHEVSENFKKWIDAGNHARMEYLERHIPLRKHPDSVLMGVKTIISLAYSYFPLKWRSNNLPVISCYAYGEDYHEVIKRRLLPVVSDLREQIGGNWRICVDSAPLEERYWAVESGIAKRAKNCSVIIPGYGSFCFLAEILTDVEIDQDSPCRDSCENCGICMTMCPTKALKGDGTLDSRKCINYLTIEKRGAWDEKSGEVSILNLLEGRVLYGCDMCLKCCPENSKIKKKLRPEFYPTDKLLNLSENEILEMTESEFKEFFSKSAIKRAKYEGILRNAQKCAENKEYGETSGSLL